MCCIPSSASTLPNQFADQTWILRRPPSRRLIKPQVALEVKSYIFSRYCFDSPVETFLRSSSFDLPFRKDVFSFQRREIGVLNIQDSSARRHFLFIVVRVKAVLLFSTRWKDNCRDYLNLVDVVASCSLRKLVGAIRVVENPTSKSLENPTSDLLKSDIRVVKNSTSELLKSDIRVVKIRHPSC